MFMCLIAFCECGEASDTSEHVGLTTAGFDVAFDSTGVPEEECMGLFDLKGGEEYTFGFGVGFRGGLGCGGLFGGFRGGLGGACGMVKTTAGRCEI